VSRETLVKLAVAAAGVLVAVLLLVAANHLE
jgi:hypothetical protein